MIDKLNGFHFPVSQPTVFDSEEMTVLDLVSKTANKTNEVVEQFNNIEETITNAQTSETNAKASETNAKTSENNAKASEINASLVVSQKANQIDLDTEKSERLQEIDVERQRINSFINLAEGSTTGDAELIDTRIDANGKIHISAGEALRDIGKGLGIVNNSILPSKLTYQKTFNIKDLPIAYVDSRIDSTGAIISSGTMDVYVFDCAPSVQSIVFTMGTSLTPKARYTNGTYSTDIADTTTRRMATGKIYFNKEKANNTSGYLTITVTYFKLGWLNEDSYNALSDTSFNYQGSINTSGVKTDSISNVIHKVIINSNYDYYTTYDGLGSYAGAFYTSSDVFISGVTITTGKINTPPSNASYMLLTISPNTNITMKKKSQEVLIKKTYENCLNKPYIFNGKSALFFGDSIVKGFINGTTITPNGFPKLFCDSVGMTFTNKGVGGALFTSGYNEIETIFTTIQNTVLNKDFIFIGGGTNAFGLGVSLASFKTTISNLCSYLSENYNGEVIFITPINRIRSADTYIADLNEYRNIISEYALINGFSVIDGSKLNFPNTIGDFSLSVFGDDIHPSEIGYRMYANTLKSILL